MKHLAFICLLALSLDAVAGDYATCLLKNLPGLQNEAAANAAIALCMKEYPGGVRTVEQGSGRGWLSYKSGAECAMKKAADTRSQLAGSGIYLACRLLYDEPSRELTVDQFLGNRP
jgi:hypothetical protein